MTEAQKITPMLKIFIGGAWKLVSMQNTLKSDSFALCGMQVGIPLFCLVRGGYLGNVLPILHIYLNI
nr:hypothetical protein Iba_chr08bCG2730 [Ipomoea batatas]